MSDLSTIQRAEKISHLFIAIMEKIVTERALKESCKESCEEQVTPAQLQALRYLLSNDAPLMGEIAQGLRISLPAATKAIDRLVKKELVSREEDPSDRRVVRIRLTEHGRKLVFCVLQRKNERLSEIIKNMSVEEQNYFWKGIEGFVRSAIREENVAKDICLHCGSAHTEDCIVREELRRLQNALGLEIDTPVAG